MARHRRRWTRQPPGSAAAPPAGVPGAAGIEILDLGHRRRRSRRRFAQRVGHQTTVGRVRRQRGEPAQAARRAQTPTSRTTSWRGRKPIRKTLPPASWVSVENAMTLILASRAIGLTASTSAASSGPRISCAPSAIAERAAAGGAPGGAAGVARHQGQPFAWRSRTAPAAPLRASPCRARHWRPTAARSSATLTGPVAGGGSGPPDRPRHRRRREFRGRPIGWLRRAERCRYHPAAARGEREQQRESSKVEANRGRRQCSKDGLRQGCEWRRDPSHRTPASKPGAKQSERQSPRRSGRRRRPARRPWTAMRDPADWHPAACAGAGSASGRDADRQSRRHHAARALGAAQCRPHPVRGHQGDRRGCSPASASTSRSTPITTTMPSGCGPPFSRRCAAAKDSRWSPTPARRWSPTPATSWCGRRLPRTCR